MAELTCNVTLYCNNVYIKKSYKDEWSRNPKIL